MNRRRFLLFPKTSFQAGFLLCVSIQNAALFSQVLLVSKLSWYSQCGSRLAVRSFNHRIQNARRMLNQIVGRNWVITEISPLRSLCPVEFRSVADSTSKWFSVRVSDRRPLQNLAPHTASHRRRPQLSQETGGVQRRDMSPALQFLEGRV